MQIHTLTAVQGGGGLDGPPPPYSFLYAAVFWNDFPFSGKPLIWYSLQAKVYFMGGFAAGDLWHYQQWSPSWPPSYILSRIRNQVKNSENEYFFALNM